MGLSREHFEKFRVQARKNAAANDAETELFTRLVSAKAESDKAYYDQGEFPGLQSYAGGYYDALLEAYIVVTGKNRNEVLSLLN
jgi:hypothetical protein